MRTGHAFAALQLQLEPLQLAVEVGRPSDRTRPSVTDPDGTPGTTSTLTRTPTFAVDVRRLSAASQRRLIQHEAGCEGLHDSAQVGECQGRLLRPALG